MRRTLLLAACLVVTLAAPGDGKIDDPKFKSASAKKALDDYKKGLARLEDQYRKGLDKARADYVKALGEARKEAIKANDLEEAQSIVTALKDADDAATAKKVAAVRQRLAGSVWAWDTKENMLTLHADGTATANWQKNEKEKGYWHVNPDLTVLWLSPGHGVACVMKFNADYTAHETYVPKRDELKRAGKRIK